MAETQEATGLPQKPPAEGGQAPKTNGAAQPWNGLLPLRKPVIANGENVSELKFREPTGGDIERIGCPIMLSVFEAQPKPIYDGAIMTMMMAHLAGVPPSTIRQLDPRDWQNGAMMLFHFFVPDQFIT
jgi:hypothetical protein